MNRTRFLILTAAAVLLLPGVVFAGGEKEQPAAAAATAAVDVELGAVINRPYEVTDPRTGEKGRTVVIERFKASPMWKAMVEAGELPPVDERLPEEPLVLRPLESIGKYGGTMVYLRTPIYRTTFSQQFQLEHLVTWTAAFYEEMNPNVAKGWEISADAKTTTLFLREGMKWSDGAPFTADAIVWWFENIIKNDELYPSKPAFLLTQGNLPSVTKIDDTTVRFAFTHPNPMFLENCARIRPMPYAPAHYLEQFHPAFTARAEIDRMMGAEDYDQWSSFFRDKWNFYGNPEIPGISGWMPTNTDTDEILRLERNPYYWKVDTEGNQLPYTDRVDNPFVQDNEAWTLRALAGELTIAPSNFVGGQANLSLFLQNQERGNYNIVYNVWPPNNRGSVEFNYGSPDPAKRQLFNDRRFRMALIKAIDYDEINGVIYDGAALPSWPRSVAPYEPDSELFFRYMGQDIREANALLDDIGLTARDRDGFRLGPDGRDLTLIAISSTGFPEETTEIAEFYRKYFEQIGIRMMVRVLSGAVIGQVVQAGEFDLHVGARAPGGRPMNVFDRGTLLPASPTWNVSRPWAAWILSDGAEGIEPPDYVKRLREIHEIGMVEPSEARRNELVMEAFEIWTENLLVIPGFTEPRQYAVVDSRLRNFAIEGEPHGSELHTSPSQIFYFE